MMFRSRGLSAGLGVAALLAIQCGQAPAAQTEWKRSVIEESHFSIAVPPEWIAIDLDPATVDSRLDEIGAANPELGKSFSPNVRALIKSGVKFMAFDAAADFSKVTHPTSVNVIFNPKPFDGGMEKYVAEGVAEFKALAGVQGEPTHGLLEVNGHQAGRIGFRSIPDPATGAEVTMTQVYVLVDGGSLTFTFTTPSSQSAHYEAVFKEITESIRILD